MAFNSDVGLAIRGDVGEEVGAEGGQKSGGWVICSNDAGGAGEGGDDGREARACVVSFVKRPGLGGAVRLTGAKLDDGLIVHGPAPRPEFRFEGCTSVFLQTSSARTLREHALFFVRLLLSLPLGMLS